MRIRRALPANGTTVTVAIPGVVSKFHARDALVYLPPAWFTDPEPHLSVTVLLAGEPSSLDDWARSGEAGLVASALAAARHELSPIIVMPDQKGSAEGGTECVNSKAFGNAETYIATDVPSFVRAHFAARSDASSLAIVGASAGGTCLLVLALRNSGIFQTFASFSGYATPTYLDDSVPESIRVLYGGSHAEYLARDPITLMTGHRYPGLAGWLEGGLSDHETHAAAEALIPVALKAGITTCRLFISGGHDFSVWAKAFEAALPWITGRLHLTAPPTTTAASCTATA